MQSLNIPYHELKFKNDGSSRMVYDVYRNKYVAFTPEEAVRQYFLAYLTIDLKYPAGLIAVETEIKVFGLSRRCDAVVYSKNRQPVMILEFKAPEVSIDQKTIDQVCNYNLKLNVGYFIVSNGLNHFCGKVDSEQQKLHFINEIPLYETLE